MNILMCMDITPEMRPNNIYMSAFGEQHEDKRP